MGLSPTWHFFILNNRLKFSVKWNVEIKQYQWANNNEISQAPHCWAFAKRIIRCNCFYFQKIQKVESNTSIWNKASLLFRWLQVKLVAYWSHIPVKPMDSPVRNTINKKSRLEDFARYHEFGHHRKRLPWHGDLNYCPSLRDGFN